MKSAILALLLLLVAGCASETQSVKSRQASVSSDYSARPLADGSIDITVHARADLSGNDKVDFPLGDMLKAAAAKECPNGYDLTPDKLPTTHVRGSGVMVAELHGVARCK